MAPSLLLKAGDRLGKYEIVRLLGRGGMAEVYEASDTQFGRKVALKVLPPTVGAQDDTVERFQREVREAAKLDHRGIVTVFDGGEDRGLLYFSMRILRKGDLADRIQRGLSPIESLAILREVSDAVGHAHASGLVHRDIKPSNILFDDHGAPVVTDFGIAKANVNTKVTRTGMLVGTPRYMSPEQFKGAEIDARSDFYSLGAVAFEMLSGHAPYDSEQLWVLMNSHINEPVPRLPTELSRFQVLVDRMMSKEPAGRPQDSVELVSLIDSMLRQIQPQDRVARKRIGTRGVPSLPSNPSLGSTSAVDRYVDNVLRKANADPTPPSQLPPSSRHDELTVTDEVPVNAPTTDSTQIREIREDILRAEAARLAAQERLRQEQEGAARKAEAERQRKLAEEAARQKAEAERKRQEAEAARLAEEERLRKEKEEATRQAEAERQRQLAEEAARQKAEAERKRQEAEAARLAEEERLLKEREEAARRTEAEQLRLQQLAEEVARQKAEAERKRQEAEAARLAEEERLRKEQEEAARLAEAERQRQLAEDAARQKAEAERKRQEAETARVAEKERLRKEKENARLAEAERQRQLAEEAASQKADAQRRRLEAEAESARVKAEARLREEQAEAARQSEEQRQRRETETEATRKKIEERRRLAPSAGTDDRPHAIPGGRHEPALQPPPGVPPQQQSTRGRTRSGTGLALTLLATAAIVAVVISVRETPEIQLEPIGDAKTESIDPGSSARGVDTAEEEKRNRREEEERKRKEAAERKRIEEEDARRRAAVAAEQAARERARTNQAAKDKARQVAAEQARQLAIEREEEALAVQIKKDQDEAEANALRERDAAAQAKALREKEAEEAGRKRREEEERKRKEAAERKRNEEENRKAAEAEARQITEAKEKAEREAEEKRKRDERNAMPIL